MEHPNPPLPPLTAEEFNDGAGYTYRGVPIIENEGGDWVFAYGHVDHETFADAVSDYDAEATLCDPTDPDQVEHLHAITLVGPDGPDGWFITWSGITAETPGAFPITAVTR
ncbi:hypothetical protein [Cellulomonas taurus]|uniref:hypothetical protein n=1 Tax=Cellulomonas taurus TaxID=2729175 RepID=UPI00145E037C|nr:hypothetical protein [Cellulomonas taurus]